MSRFCTCHDSLAVVARAESRHDLIIIIKLEQFSKELITKHEIIKLLWNARPFEVTHIHEYVCITVTPHPPHPPTHPHTTTTTTTRGGWGCHTTTTTTTTTRGGWGCCEIWSAADYRPLCAKKKHTPYRPSVMWKDFSREFAIMIAKSILSYFILSSEDTMLTQSRLLQLPDHCP